eukprot:768726-Hanusia_phi.AAC.3
MRPAGADGEAESVELVYDACSLIHMWRQLPTPEQGLALAVKEIHRALRPGGFLVVVSDVTHPDAQETFSITVRGGDAGGGADGSERRALRVGGGPSVLHRRGGGRRGFPAPQLLLEGQPAIAIAARADVACSCIQRGTRNEEEEASNVLTRPQANMSSHVLDTRHLHTCEALPEVSEDVRGPEAQGVQGELRLMVANFVLRRT